MEAKVKKLLQRLIEVEALLGNPDVFLDQNYYRELTQEHSYLLGLKETWMLLQRYSDQLIENKALLLEEKDPEMIRVIKDELADLEKQIVHYRKEVETILVPPDPHDSRNVIMELRAGTGGDEAALFVADCVEMYRAYAIKKKWGFETLSYAPSEKGGFKEYVVAVSGKNVFRFLQYEAGTHRVQRVPATETQGRVHTSAITIAVLMEPIESDFQVDEKDIQMDTFRASGAGGQHVNKTDSAVRLTHLPTGTVVSCQEERSQHKNREKAMRLLVAKIAEEKRAKEEKELSALRVSQIGSGDRSEKIRTYNFPQNRVTDHRIDLTLYKLDQVMQGDLDEITSALVSHFYQQKLTS